MPEGSFAVIRRGTAGPKQSENRPPAAMLNDVEDGTVVAGPDGVQWIAMPAVPRRWERTKKPINAAAVQPVAAPAAQTSNRK